MCNVFYKCPMQIYVVHICGRSNHIQELEYYVTNFSHPMVVDNLTTIATIVNV